MYSVKINYCPTNGELSLAAKGPSKPMIINIINAWKKDPLIALSKDPFHFLIVLQTYQECIKDFDPNYSFAQDELVYSTNSEFLPLIHIVDEDLFNKNDVCRWKKIVDSSIWNQYIVYEESSIINNLKKVVVKIGKYYDEGRYSLSVAYEYGDFYARMVKQSHLYDGSVHNDLSPFLFHSEKEMETKIKCYDNPLKKHTDITLQTLCQYRWRFLLLDDKSIEPMSGPNNQKINTCKLQLISHNLSLLGFDEDNIWFRVFDFQPVRLAMEGHVLEGNRIIENDKAGNPIEPLIQFGRVKNGAFKTNVTGKTKFTACENPSSTKDIQIVIDCVKHVDAAQYCLQKYKYEIILLDYLLDKDIINCEQEYGYQLLEKLYEWHKLEEDEFAVSEKKMYVPGPNKRFHFMFTSAFTTAVHERMLEQGFAKSERGLWYIGDGACPTNTPYLFAYQLLLLMRHRIKDLRKDNEGSQLTIIDLLEQIYVEKGEAGTERTRQKAHDHFNHLLFMRDKYKRLENDFSKLDEGYLKENGSDANFILKKMRSSLLVQSAFKVVHHFSGAFFDHLQHLVYLTAFGTIRQSDEMDIELNNVYKELIEYDDIISKVDGERTNRGCAVCDAIRNYIVELENNLIK